MKKPMDSSAGVILQITKFKISKYSQQFNAKNRINLYKNAT